MKTAIYPGSFDPITLGHLDIIRRSAPCFDRLFVCVMVNCDKKPMFSPEQRLELIRRSVADLPQPCFHLPPAHIFSYNAPARPPAGAAAPAPSPWGAAGFWPP